MGSYHPELYGSYLDFETAQAYNPPSFEQIKEFIENTISVWTNQYGVYGYKFTGPNGASVFLPAAGCRREDGLHYEGRQVYYWSSTPYGDERYGRYAYYLGSYSIRKDWNHYSGMNDGLSVRPVR